MTISILSSMATRILLAELVPAWDGEATVTSIGGVDAARRVREGTDADVVILAEAPMRALASEGFIHPDTLMPIAASAIAAAVRAGAPYPDLSNGDTLRQAILAAPKVGYSTGPSGEHLLALLDRWVIRTVMAERVVRAPPGIPVGKLLAEGTVDLGFQQRSELLGLPGIEIVGDLPPDVQLVTLFTAGIARSSANPDAARRFIEFLATPDTAEAKRKSGLAQP